MNPLRLLLAIVAVFIGIFATDFLIHGVWLGGDYAATKELWRPEAEMQKRFPWLMLGQFVAAATFVVLWAVGFADKASAAIALFYGAFMGLFSGAGMIIGYAVQPMPGELTAKWVIAGIAQGILMGLMVRFIYRPRQKTAGVAPD